MKTSISAIVSLVWCLSAYAQAPKSYADFSETFQCPENLATEHDQQNALNEFLTWAQKKYPDLTIAKVVDIRTKLLKEHHCNKTIANIYESSQEAQAQNSNTRYQCLRNDGRLYFSTVGKKKCQSIPLEAEWKNFLTEEGFMVDINPSKIVKEKDGAKILARFYLAQPSSGGSFTYNYVQSVTKYFCQTKQQLLIQGTYRLNGAVQHERLSTESVMEEIEPGTISELLLNYVCKSQSRRAPELRSCLTSEMSLVAVENADHTKSLEENKEIGRKFGYVVGEFYKKAIWAMDDPDTEGREVVMYALEKFQTRMKYMNRAQLAKEVKDCRASFGN